MYWRLFRTTNGRRIIREQLDRLDPMTKANIAAAMKDVETRGIHQASSPVRGEIREIDADGPDHTTYRLLFARDGHAKQILLGLVFFEKKTRKAPPSQIDLAEKRLSEWREGAKAALSAAAKGRPANPKP